MFFKPRQNLYCDETLAAFDWLEHGFGTREAGPWLPDTGLATLHQIHSGIVCVAGGLTGRIGEGDSLVTAVPGQMVGVRTADCVPLLIADPCRRAVAAVHAGWRGTVAGIAANTVRAMTQQFGCRPEDLVVAIGPAIGFCCYEVGPEVAGQFRELFPERNDLRGTTRLDLSEANRRILAASGVPELHISVTGKCTRCHHGEFHSYRRDGEAAGRMLAAIGIRA